MPALSLLIFLALAGSATAAVLAGGGEPGSAGDAIAAAGSFSFTNSRDGMPIFSATGIAPGDSISGSVEIADTGSEPGELTLSRTRRQRRRRKRRRPALRTVVGADCRRHRAHEPGHGLRRAAGADAGPVGRAGRRGRRAHLRVSRDPAAGQRFGRRRRDSERRPRRQRQRRLHLDRPRSDAGSGAPHPHARPIPDWPAPAPSGSGSDPASVPLRLRIVRVRPNIRRGRLLVLARCDRPCAISGRGRLSAGGAPVGASAKSDSPRGRRISPVLSGSGSAFPAMFAAGCGRTRRACERERASS